MQYRKLGTTDIKVSAVCQGCWSIVGDETWGPQDEHDSIDALTTCLDVGINFLDTAEAYGDGRSEELIGKVLADHRQELVLATKASRHHMIDPSSIKTACEASLRRLRTDYIDLYQLHWPHPEMNLPAIMAVLEELRCEGKIRAIGVSNFGCDYFTELLQCGHVESNQLCYSLLWRPVEAELSELCTDNNVSLLCYSPSS